MTRTPTPSAATPRGDTSAHLRRARHGDRASIAFVVTRLSPLLLAQADYRLGPELRALHDPEDLVADVWAIALQKLDQLPDSPRVTPVLLRFLCTTMARRISNLLRRHIRPNARSVGDDVLIQLPAQQIGVVTDAVRRENASRVLALLTQLDPRDREIVILRGIEQNDTTTVAGLLGMRPNTVAQRYRRALQRIRDAVPGSVFDELAS